jgi:hypothetical protein
MSKIGTCLCSGTWESHWSLALIDAKLGLVVFIHFQTFVISSGDTRHLLAHFIIDASNPSIIFMGPVYSHHGLFRLLLRALFRPSRATMGHFRKQESKMVS